jgi:hypothetical protein
MEEEAKCPMPMMTQKNKNERKWETNFVGGEKIWNWNGGAFAQP